MEYISYGSLEHYLSVHKENICTRDLLKFALDVAMVCMFLVKQLWT